MNNLMKTVLMTALALAVLFLCGTSAAAQNYNRYEDSYNYQKAKEAYYNEDERLAEEAFEKELDEHPDNGYAYFYLSHLTFQKNELGKALEQIDKALCHVPRRDRSFRASCYYTKARYLVVLDKSDDAITNFSEAIRLNPKSEIYYQERAEVYYHMGKYDLADADYLMIKKINPNHVAVCMGMGRNELARQHYFNAVELFTECVALYNEYSLAYSFRADAYFHLGNFMDAAKDVVRAMAIDYDQKSFVLMVSLADSAFVQIKTKLQAQAIKDPKNAYWPYCLGIVHEQTQHYEEAIDYYQQCDILDESSSFHQRISSCYAAMGQWNSAISSMGKAIEMDTSEMDLLFNYANLHYESGHLQKAIQLMDEYVKSKPDCYEGYYWRGWYKENFNQLDEAIEDYTMSIALNPDYLYAYLTRGNMYTLKGCDDMAQKDYQALIIKDTIPEFGSCRMYALQHLGRTEEALDWMKLMLDSDEYEGTRYEAACLYVMVGDKEKALDYLEEALELGCKSYYHIMTDDQLEPLRQMKRFHEIMQRFFSDTKENKAALIEDAKYIETIHEVPFVRKDGILKVQCKINGLPLHFVFDTGASTVSISSLEASFMYKNNFLSSDDVVGNSEFIDANGDISIGTLVNLNDVEFAGLKLKNVKANVVANNSAPLLLGQSVLNRLGKVEIDYQHQILKITTKERVQ